MATDKKPDHSIPWDKCDHEWETQPGDWDYFGWLWQCVKCGCPGSSNGKDDRDVYWPAT